MNRTHLALVVGAAVVLDPAAARAAVVLEW